MQTCVCGCGKAAEIKVDDELYTWKCMWGIPEPHGVPIIIPDEDKKELKDEPDSIQSDETKEVPGPDNELQDDADTAKRCKDGDTKTHVSSDRGPGVRKDNDGKDNSEESRLHW
jgi:hypothetical protein